MIELDAAGIAANRDVVRALEPQHRIRNPAGLIAREALLSVVQSGKPVGERKAGWSPVLRLLIVAADPRVARYVDAVGEVRCIAHRVAAVLRAQSPVQRLVEGVPPAQIEVDPR